LDIEKIEAAIAAFFYAHFLEILNLLTTKDCIILVI
jgi:hypothetical protein